MYVASHPLASSPSLSLGEPFKKQIKKSLFHVVRLMGLNGFVRLFYISLSFLVRSNNLIGTCNLENVKREPVDIG